MTKWNQSEAWRRAVRQLPYWSVPENESGRESLCPLYAVTLSVPQGAVLSANLLLIFIIVHLNLKRQINAFVEHMVFLYSVSVVDIFLEIVEEHRSIYKDFEKLVWQKKPFGKYSGPLYWNYLGPLIRLNLSGFKSWSKSFFIDRTHQS